MINRDDGSEFARTSLMAENNGMVLRTSFEQRVWKQEAIKVSRTFGPQSGGGNVRP
jgi:hypothetical protein